MYCFRYLNLLSEFASAQVPFFFENQLNRSCFKICENLVAFLFFFFLCRASFLSVISFQRARPTPRPRVLEMRGSSLPPRSSRLLVLSRGRS
ncbi:hypothetical protein BRADI_4g21585v3 [Brachypodium distachyon]|uniref:Uncharacterized protein n=1 Tax=Brachypodium distachyon TaxID=15368 RepID=A0A2K2CP64_BRADI|nr:hypothetical protein BRADI_4g21585v3 [Brachypodium distachyon]